MIVRAKANLLDLYPLTALQQGILYHALASEHDDPYLVRLCFRIDGAVDAEALQRRRPATLARDPVRTGRCRSMSHDRRRSRATPSARWCSPARSPPSSARSPARRA